MRPIDGDALLEKLNRKKAGPANQKYTDGFNDCLMRVRSMVHSAPTLTPQNEPLTMDELLKMDGEPIWVKCLKPSQYADPPVRWRIFEKSITGNFGVWNGDCALIERTYGVDWMAYRRPPEGEA